MVETYEDTTAPHVPSDAEHQRRLINFETGKAVLLPGHAAWLDELLKSTPATREFECHVYGYASKLGDATKNETLSFNRAMAVANYLTERDAKYDTRIKTFKAIGEKDPKYIAGESDNDGRWRAVEAHMKYDKPPIIKPGTDRFPPRQLRTHMKWSVCGYFGLMASFYHVAQTGIAIFKFRDDETRLVYTYISPMFGIGGGYDYLKFLGFLKNLVTNKMPQWTHLLPAIEKALKDPKHVMNPYAAIKEIGKSILTGVGVQDWTDFSKCNVYHP